MIDSGTPCPENGSRAPARSLIRAKVSAVFSVEHRYFGVDVRAMGSMQQL
jgi:hypothetical protein